MSVTDPEAIGFPPPGGRPEPPPAFHARSPGPAGELGRALRRSPRARESGCPLLAVFACTLHDSLPRPAREGVVARIPGLLRAARSDGAGTERVRLATEWLVSEFCDRWLRCAGLAPDADVLAARSRAATGLDPEWMDAWADSCDRRIQSRLAALPPSLATEAWVFADGTAGLSGGAAAAALCRDAALGARRASGPPPPWFSVPWRAWASGWFALNLVGAEPGAESRSAAIRATLQDSAFRLLDSMIEVR